MFRDITFANPDLFYLLLILLPVAAWYIFRSMKGKPDMQVSSTRVFENLGLGWRVYFYHALFVLRLISIALLITALARPQSSSKSRDVTIEGIDIVIAMDISSSMLAEDFRPNRLEASKAVASDFIQGRENDRMGLVIFSGETFTQCPLTTDHGVLMQLFDDLKTGMIDDGTAIGDGLATAVSRLKDSKAISKVIILLTDGENNMGSLDPISAAEIAKLYGIRIYTIGIGTQGTAPYPFQTPRGKRYQNIPVKIDEELLQQVAEMANGRYFRATNKKKLSEIYHEIDEMEKSKIDVTEFSKKKEEFLPLALLALLIFLLELILRQSIFRTLP